MELTATTPAPATPTDHASRPPVPAPEGDIAPAEALVTEDPARPAAKAPESIIPEPLVPVEPKLPKAPPQAANDTASEHEAPAHPAVPVATTYVTEDERKAAEEALAKYVGAKISSVAAKDLTLDLHRCPTSVADHQLRDGIKLRFTGASIEGNELAFGKEVIKALHEHTAFARVMDKDSQPILKWHPDHPNELCVVVPNLTEAQSKSVFDALRGVAVAQQPPAPIEKVEETKQAAPWTAKHEPKPSHVAALDAEPQAAVAR